MLDGESILTHDARSESEGGINVESKFKEIHKH